MGWLKSLRQQSDYRGDWYGALTNQVAHTAMGVFFAAMFAAVWRWRLGEMPPRAMMIAVVTGSYALVELAWQRWENSDSLVDIYMVFIGSAMVSTPFYQAEIVKDGTLLYFVHMNFLYCSAAWVAVLIPYVILRGLASPR